MIVPGTISSFSGAFVWTELHVPSMACSGDCFTSIENHVTVVLTCIKGEDDIDIYYVLDMRGAGWAKHIRHFSVNDSAVPL